ncbi:MAG: RNA methyltransferase substrate-binding domain-containing protein, partial [Vicinamibacteria bacterium]
MKQIESSANPLFKTIRRLAHPRKREPKILLEGRKLVRAALQSGVEIETVLVSTRVTEEPILSGDTPIVRTSETLFRKVSSLDTPDGILAVARRPYRSLDELPARGYVVVSAGIQDPGN